MAFKRLGPIVKQVVSRLVIDAGEGSGETLPDAMKGTGTGEGAGQVAIREVIPTQRADEGHAPASPANGRPIVTAQTKRRPTSAVAIGLVLVVDNGRGGGRRQEGEASAAYRAATGRERVREFLKLVGG